MDKNGRKRNLYKSQCHSKLREFMTKTRATFYLLEACPFFFLLSSCYCFCPWLITFNNSEIPIFFEDDGQNNFCFFDVFFYFSCSC